ncbi:TPA: hypothetical protein ACH3X1_000294 [Trebouxia sp. C0004]
MTDSPSSAALPATEPGGSDPSADAATIPATARATPTAAAAAAAAAATPSAATGSDVTTKDYYAFRGETVKLLNHFGTVVTSIQQQQISQAASLTEVSGRLAPENLGSVIASQLQPALKQFSDIVTKSISAAMKPTAINTMVVAALAAQPPQVSAPAAAPTSSFYSFGPALAPTNPIVQLPGALLAGLYDKPLLGPKPDQLLVFKRPQLAVKLESLMQAANSAAAKHMNNSLVNQAIAAMYQHPQLHDHVVGEAPVRSGQLNIEVHLSFKDASAQHR